MLLKWNEFSLPGGYTTSIDKIPAAKVFIRGGEMEVGRSSTVPSLLLDLNAFPSLSSAC